MGCKWSVGNAARFICVVLLFAIRTAFRVISVDSSHQTWGMNKSKANRSAPDGKYNSKIFEADVLKVAIRVL